MQRLTELEHRLIKDEQKVAVVTGSLSGIGLGIAHCLANQGYHIVLNGFAPEEEIARTIADFKQKYPKVIAHFIFADLMKAQDCKTLISQTLKKFSRVDVLVNNAGIQHIDECVNFPQKKWQDVLALNLSAAFYLSKYSLPGMVSRGWGRIVNISSVHGLVASVNKSAYVAAKHGLVGFTKAIALQYAKKGITVNAICPGFVYTPLIEKQIELIAKRDNVTFETAKKKLVEEKQPSGAFSSTKDLGELVVFLVGEHSKQVNGAAWTMDGGWTAQ